MAKQTLLVGNDINKINNNYGWKDLIDNLIEFIGATGEITYDDNKPFPLLYEEIYVEAERNQQKDETSIKKFISEDVSHISLNQIHQRIINANYENILTTNYDLTFEQVLSNNVDKLKNDGTVKENLYSIFRHYRINDKRIWHIHGDANYSHSITLGYEHYSGYLQQMRNYIVSGTGSSYKREFEPLRNRIRHSLNEYHSWLDFFFTHDVHIIGLRLDFVEIHLWWLLTYRQRAILRNKLPVSGDINYYYPAGLTGEIKNKLDLFKSVGVKAIPHNYNENNRSKYYNAILDKI